MTAFLSGKGGVGKSTICAGTAYALAKMGSKVALIDVDFNSSTQSIIAQIGEPDLPDSSEKGLIPKEKDGVKGVSLAPFLKSPDSPVIDSDDVAQEFIKQFLISFDWGDVDDFVIDLPPGGGVKILGVQETFGKIDGAVVITQPSRLSLDPVRRTVRLLFEFNIPIIGVVENMTGLYKGDAGQRLCDLYALNLLAQIPFNPQIEERCDIGEFPEGQEFDKIAEEINAYYKTDRQRMGS